MHTYIKFLHVVSQIHHLMGKISYYIQQCNNIQIRQVNDNNTTMLLVSQLQRSKAH